MAEPSNVCRSFVQPQPCREQVLSGWAHAAIYYHKMSDHLLNRLMSEAFFGEKTGDTR